MKDNIACGLAAVAIMIAAGTSYTLLEPGFVKDLTLVFLIVGISWILWIIAWCAVRSRFVPYGYSERYAHHRIVELAMMTAGLAAFAVLGDLYFLSLPVIFGIGFPWRKVSKFLDQLKNPERLPQKQKEDVFA